MLHYPRLKIPEERFAWIYLLAVELEPKAEIYYWEDRQKNIKESWAMRLKAKEFQEQCESEALETLAWDLLKYYPRDTGFFSFLIDAYLMQGRMEYAQHVVEKRKTWLIKYPYKVIGRGAIEIGWPDSVLKAPNGIIYKLSMGDWISALRTIQFYEIDIEKKIKDCFVFRQRPRRK